MKGIYLDHNATTRALPEVVAELRACLEGSWGNPSSLHAHGQEARRVLDRARERVAALMDADPQEIVFTSGGTESDNLALRGGLRAALQAGLQAAMQGGPERQRTGERHVLVSAIEHAAVLDCASGLEAEGCEVERLPVDAQGRLDLEALRRALRPDTALLSLMLANNDLGTLQPLEEALAIARSASPGIVVHTDAVQALGKLPLSARRLGVDLMSVSAHKLHGPKGVGALYVRRGLKLPALMEGGPQEHRMRAGTENLPGIAAFGMACELAGRNMAERTERIAALRDRLEQGILAAVPGSRVNGHPSLRVCNTTNLAFPGLRSEDLLLNLDLEGVSASAGAACHAESGKPSHVLLALGQDEAAARSALRFSLGEENTEEEIGQAVAITAAIVARLRGEGA